MAVDAMAAAIDWLDAYRAGDVASILNMYADDAVIECGCDGVTVTGKESLRAYWERRLREYPASDLDDLRSYAEGATIFYIAGDGVVAATMEFNAEGLISRLRCGPST
jgi:ketosteroid isomerase-like protein